MSSLTINIQEDIKKSAQNKSKSDGLTLTFVVTQALKAYAEGKLQFGLLADNDITASFDVSSDSGKKACIESFKPQPQASQ